MADREFIHSTADVHSTLLYALDAGLQVIHSAPYPEPGPHMVTREEAAWLKGGDFFLFQPDWVFGPFVTSAISAGYYKGQYSTQPRTNYSSVAVYFQGERIDQGRRRFGSCSVSCYPDWLKLPEKVLLPAPPEVRKWYKRILAHLSSGIVVKGGVHRYHITRGVLADPSASECLPPFDYIPWGSDVLKRPGR